MQPYVLLSTKYIDYSDKQQETFVGFLDPNNKGNNVTLLDIFKAEKDSIDRSSNRLSRVLYELGIQFSFEPIVDGVNTNSGRFTVNTFSVKISLRDGINTNAFRFITLDTDLFNDAVNEDGSLTETLLNDFNSKVGTLDYDATGFINKIVNDVSDFINNRFSALQPGMEKLSYNVYEGKLLVGSIDGLEIINHVAYKPKSMIMSNPDAQLPINVPTFYELMCEINYEKKMETMEDDTDDIEGMTSLFSKPVVDSVPFTDFKSIYKPLYQASAVTTIETDGSTIPVINPERVKVASVTKFWDVYPITNIPKETYGKKFNNDSYTQEDLTGTPKNVHLTLQANERPFYNAMKELMDIATAIEFNAFTDSEFEKVVADGKKSMVVENFCKTLSEQAFNICWAHTATTQAVYPDTNPEDSADTDNTDLGGTYNLPCRWGTVIKDPGTGSYVFKTYIESTGAGGEVKGFVKDVNQNLPRLNTGFDGSIEQGFVHHDGNIVGFVNMSTNRYRWIEALIRLLRWGDRKPSMLSLESLVKGEEDSGNKTYWDLNNCCSSKNDGNLENLTKVVDKYSGNVYSFAGIITADIAVDNVIQTLSTLYGNSFIRDLQLSNNMLPLHVPVGVVLYTKYEGTNIIDYYYEDIFTYFEKAKTMQRGILRYNQETDSYFLLDGFKEVPEFKLSDIIRNFKNPDSLVNMNGVSYRVKYSVPDNVELKTSLHELINGTMDTKSKNEYMNMASGRNIFTAVSSYCTATNKTDFINRGSMLYKTKRYTSSTMRFFNYEDARIMYSVMPQLLKMAFNPGQVNSDTGSVMSDFEMIVSKYDAIRKAANIQEDDSTDTVYTSFVKFINECPSNYGFIKLDKAGEVSHILIGRSLNKDVNLMIFALDSDVERFERETNNKLRIGKVKPFDSAVKLLKGVRNIYNKHGKSISDAVIKEGNGTVILSSKELIDFVVKEVNDIETRF